MEKDNWTLINGIWIMKKEPEVVTIKGFKVE